MLEPSGLVKELHLSPAATNSTAPLRVLLPARTRRQSPVSVLLRPLLAAPFIAIAVIYAVLASLAALTCGVMTTVTGRTVEPLRLFTLNYTRFLARVLSHFLILNRRFPSFGGTESAPKVATVIDSHEELSRAQAALRIIVMIPSLVVALLMLVGLAILMVPMWLAATVTGKVPASLHRAAVFGVRFVVRQSAFAMLITSTSPFAHFDDLIEDVPVREGEESSPDEATSDGTKILVIAVVVLGMIGVGGAITYEVTRPPGFDGPHLLKVTSELVSQNENTVMKFNKAARACKQDAHCVSVAAMTAAFELSERNTRFQRQGYLFPKPAESASNLVIEHAQTLEQDFLPLFRFPTPSIAKQQELEQTTIAPMVLAMGSALDDLRTVLERY